MTTSEHFEVELAKTVDPLGRMATTDDLVGLYQFLASDASAYITGNAITADGGMNLGYSRAALRQLGAPF